MIFSKKMDLIDYLTSNGNQNKIGFVPTMGALHLGHLTLLKASVAENDTTVISIFVNPTQFNNPDDLNKYPRNLDADIDKILSVSDKILVYAPDIFDIYGDNTKSGKFDFDGLEYQMEGKHRPGHFDGVGTIVKKLFAIVQPANAYFGEKDFQQLQIIRKLVEKLKLPIKIIQVPVFREENGLAMSSRNERLSDSERYDAAIIYKTLLQVGNIFESKTVREIKKWVENYFATNKDFELEYFEISDEKTLIPCRRKAKNKKYRAFIAVNVKGVRLIDTKALN